MRTLLAITLLLSPFAANSGVYKWMGPDGRVQYSDRPVEGAESLGIEIDNDSKSPGGEDTGEDGAQLGPYDNFEIVAPETNQTLRDADGKVRFSLLIEPPLIEGHRLRLLLNGQPIPGEVQGPQIHFRGVTVGSHRVQAQILDDFDEVVASSQAIDFHMRKPVPEEPGS